MPHPFRPSRRPLLAAALSLALAMPFATRAGAQIIRNPGAATTTTAAPVDSSTPPIERARASQADFERFRRMNLPSYRGPKPPSGNCDEKVGRFCYWYDEVTEMTPEPSSVAQRRKVLIAVLDTLARAAPYETWIAGQRIRYLVEDGRPADAVKAAGDCTGGTWWCEALLGYALHSQGEYERADSVFNDATSKMLPRDACAWRDISPLLDQDATQQYRRLPCEDPKRRAFEDRTWWFARTLYLMHGNDSRTEYFSRLVLAQLLKDAANTQQFGFDDDERELMLRFGPSIAWARGPSSNPRDRGGFDIITEEPKPAYRYIPAGFVLNNPAISDSADWRLQLPPVMGRYAPPYARTFKPLEHQKAMFRRGDTALVVVSYNASGIPQMMGTPVEAALTVSPGDSPKSYQARKSGGTPEGILTARAPWGPLIMSTEVAAPERKTVARARYGMSPPYAVGTRVSLSDLLFYKPYGSFPMTAEEAIPHALPTERVNAKDKLGVFWEAYGTDPNGEKMEVSLRVERETKGDPSFFQRRAAALGLGREVTPVSVTVQDVSAPGQRMSPRAIELDISTLPKGAYVVHLEISVSGQYTITTDHRIEIVTP